MGDAVVNLCLHDLGGFKASSEGREADPERGQIPDADVHNAPQRYMLSEGMNCLAGGQWVKQKEHKGTEHMYRDDGSTQTNEERYKNECGSPIGFDELLKSSEYRRPRSSSTTKSGCVFCGYLGTTATCGDLITISLAGEDTTFHHACALWAPDVYQKEGSDVYENIGAELVRSQGTRCSCCGDVGASVKCLSSNCSAAWHLPCAIASQEVILDKASFEGWCMKHAPSQHGSRSRRAHSSRFGRRARFLGEAEEDESDALLSMTARPRRLTTLSRKNMFARSHGSKFPCQSAADIAAAAVAVSDRVQRPRTDWQRHGDLWVKVVPPWWCDQKTVHFANKVFKELFMSNTRAPTIDASGMEWDCVIQIETRNDMRLQYTLRGQFQDFWDAAGVSAGDVLTFERLADNNGKIRIMRYPHGRGIEEALAGRTGPAASSCAPCSVPKALHALNTASQFSISNAETSPRSIRPNNSWKMDPGASVVFEWLELPDGSAVKTLSESDFNYNRCPIPERLFTKLFGGSIRTDNRVMVHDTETNRDIWLETAVSEYAQDVLYLTANSFCSWLQGFRSSCGGGSMRLWRQGTTVMMSRPMTPTSVNDRVLDHGQNLAEFHQETKLLPETNKYASSRENHKPLDILAAAATFADLYGTPGLESLLQPAKQLKQEADPHHVSAKDIQPQSQSFGRENLQNECLAHTKKRRVDIEGEEAKVARYPCADNIVHCNSAIGSQLPLAFHNIVNIDQHKITRIETGSNCGVAAGFPGTAILQAMPSARNNTNIWEGVATVIKSHEWNNAERKRLVSFYHAFESMNQTIQAAIEIKILAARNDKAALLQVMDALVNESS